MNYQQWRPLIGPQSHSPFGKSVAINTGGYVFRGKVTIRPGTALLQVTDGLGNVYPHSQIENWSWSATEPEQEMLMVKPHGIFVAHWWNEVGHLLRIITELDVKFFVEIGLLDGGLTAQILSTAEYTGMRYLGIDPNAEHYVDKRVWSKIEGLSEIHADVWVESAWDQSTISTLATQLPPINGRTMIYCDGGDKAKEAHLYWPILRPGDLLGLHDYSDDPESKGPEVFPKDVADLLEQGKRIGKEELAETRILLLEKP